MHSELVKIILAYAETTVFVFTAFITCLSLIVIVRFAEASQQKTLFKTLIVEIVVVVIGFFSNYLEFNPTEAKSKIVNEALLEKQRLFKEKRLRRTRSFRERGFRKGIRVDRCAAQIRRDQRVHAGH
jgi:high-affinity K+ transport system ATPase subunit B